MAPHLSIGHLSKLGYNGYVTAWDVMVRPLVTLTMTSGSTGNNLHIKGQMNLLEKVRV